MMRGSWGSGGGGGGGGGGGKQEDRGRNADEGGRGVVGDPRVL